MSRRERPEEAFAGMEPALRAAYERIYSRELAARERIFLEYPAYLVAGIPDHTCRRVATATVRQWLREKRIFMFLYRWHYWFPVFQFAAGSPKPLVEEVCRKIQPSNGWQTMYWFVGANGWLEGAAPVDLMDSDPDSVLEAASHANDLMSD